MPFLHVRIGDKLADDLRNLSALLRFESVSPLVRACLEEIVEQHKESAVERRMPSTIVDVKRLGNRLEEWSRAEEEREGGGENK